MTPKIVEATEVQFEEVTVVEEPKVIPINESTNSLSPTIEQGQDESLTLHDIVLYDAFGKPWRKYESVTLEPALRDRYDEHIAICQDTWIAKAKEEGKEIPSLPLLYAIIEKLHTEKHPAELSLLAELSESMFCTSTRLDYQAHAVIHEFGFSSKYTFTRQFPNTYWLQGAHNKTEKLIWQAFLNVLLQPRDTDQAMELLQTFGGSPAYVPNLVKTQGDVKKIASVYDENNSIHLDCTFDLENGAHSRLVTFK